ncbi:MAG: AsmA-like C-terminal region-containing protein [Candidatus Melainabacteria bacterium]|nr:AsmA-like C-terminal region-containing protein [Candidatus Melainabacteria bacterium]
MQSGTQEKALAQETVTSRPILFIIRFLVLWLASLIVVLAVTLLNNVNWTRPYIERSLSQALNRDVKLGKMTWSLGLNGIAISTRDLTVKEPSGEPFLTAGRSQIGLSVLPLIQKQLVITYIEVDQADVRFVKTGTNTWNIDDLLQPGPEIRLLQLTGSRIGVFDQSTPDMAKQIAPINLEKVELKLNFPKKNRKRPFFISFVLPAKGYSSSFTLDGLGVGELENWKDNQYTFKADAQNVNPRDLERLIKFISITPEKIVATKAPTKTEETVVAQHNLAAKTGTITEKKISKRIGGTTSVEQYAISKPEEEAENKLAAKRGIHSTVSTLAPATTHSVTATTTHTPTKTITHTRAVATTRTPTAATTRALVATSQTVKPGASAKSTKKEMLDVLRSINGLFNFKISGEGTFDKGIKATIDTTASGLQINSATLGQINAGSTVGSVEANVSNDNLVWTDLIVKLRGMQMRSSGALSNWQKTNPGIQANIVGNLPDLSVLQNLLKPKPGQSASRAHGLSELTQTLSPAQLTGRAEIEIKIDGTANATNLTTKVKTRDLAIKDMLTKAHQRFPILCAIGLSNQARIETDLRLQNSDRLEIINGKLIGPGTNLSATGWLDLKNDKGELTITGDKIALSNTAVGISTNDGAYKQVLGAIKLPGKNSFTLGGTATAYAHLKTDGDRYALDAKVKLNDAIFALRDNSLKLDNVDGNLAVVQSTSGGMMTLSGITGRMGEGNFQLDGRISLAQASPIVDITLHATRFDMKHLSTLMKLFQVQQMPVLTERQLYGRVKDVVLRVTGNSNNPNIFFNAVPDDLYYQPPGLAKPLRAKSGVIVYDKDQLILREVALISNGKTIVTSMTIDKVSKECILSRVKTKTDSMELADIHYYLSSTAMPPPMRKAYRDFLAKYKISGMNGKIYGDILCLIGTRGDVIFDGLVGCYKTGASVAGYPITKIEGIFAASGDQLLLQDLSGYIRGSKFSLDGYIDKYRSSSPTWRAEVAAKLAPRELFELIPHLTEEMKTSRIDVKCKGPLTLRAKVQGNFDYNKIQYSLIADKKDRLVIEGPFGKLYQPADTALTLDGLVGVNKNTIELGDTHILVGETLISLDGLLKFPEPPVETTTVKRADAESAGQVSHELVAGTSAEELVEQRKAHESAAQKVVGNTVRKPASKAEIDKARSRALAKFVENPIETVAEKLSHTAVPMIRLNFKIPQKSPVNTLIAMVDPPLAKEISGTISGFLTIDGDLRSPNLLTDIAVNDIKVPSLKVAGLNGRLRSAGGIPAAIGSKSLLKAEQLSAMGLKVPVKTEQSAAGLKSPAKSKQSTAVLKTQTTSEQSTVATKPLKVDNDKQSTRASSKTKEVEDTPKDIKEMVSPSENPSVVAVDPANSNESILEIDSVKVRQLTVTKLKAHVTFTQDDQNKSEPVIKMDKGEARLADGVMTFEAKLNPSENRIWLKALFSDVSAARIGDELVGSPDEITGKGKASIVLETHGEDNQKMMKNLRGHGSIEVENGIVSRFSDLETRLTQYNLLTQGIFGFNINNLVQSVWPTRTGEFTSLNNKFSFADGMLKVDEMRFNGKDMRMWGSGTASLVSNKVSLEIAGKIPRVSGSRIGVGVSRNITLQKMMKVVTLGRLENLPALPVLGAIATDKPRTFMFSVDSQLDNPKTVARSIEKSFKWLPNKPDATAHPVPGMITPL